MTVFFVIALKNPDLHLQSFDLLKPFNSQSWKLLIVGNSAEILTVELCFLAVRKELPEYLFAHLFGIAAKAARCVTIFTLNLAFSFTLLDRRKCRTYLLVD